MRIKIEQLETATAPESVLSELAEYHDVLDAENIPGDPPTPVAMRIAKWRHSFARFPEFRWILREHGEIAAVGLVHYDVEENLANGMGAVHVHPTRRGRGYARLLATPVLDHLEEQGRTRFETWIKRGHPAESLAEGLGLKSVYQERRSRLLIAELDRGLMRSWVERAMERASDYELLAMESPFPEDYLGKFCAMMEIMNTAPTEDYEVDDETITPETWRDIEDNVLKSQSQIHNLTVVHKPSGDFVGFTQMKTQDLQPDLAWQWDTGVHPDHRNRGLGRWLKAAMIERIILEYPEVERVDTHNAGSNEPMLNINIAMGFEAVLEENAWQGDLGTVRERLGA